MKHTARFGARTEDGGFATRFARGRIEVSAPRPSFEPTMTALTLGVCWWSLIELVLDLGTGCGDTPQFGVVAGVRLVVIISGLAAVADSRLARGIFFFLCAVSVLAIAPGIPFQFHRSAAFSLISLVECSGKAAFVLMGCASRPFMTAQTKDRLQR